MTQTSNYDERINQIRNQNKPILEGFQEALTNSNISAKTRKNHVQNIEFFAEYLVYYEPLKTLAQTESTDISSFLDDWFLRKALWSSVESVRAYLATFKKFFVWMRDTHHMSKSSVEHILAMIKEDREDFIDNAKSYFGSIYGNDFS
jgi:site-specific recombinase XerD